MSEWILDVGDADFEREVIARSERVPVVVDFWAPWCGPCRTLGPILERVVEEAGGAVVLARVNVDAAPGVAQAFGVRSIPAVKAIRDRSLVAEFEGAQPEPAVRRFFASLLPSEADHAVAAADRAREAGDAATAEAGYRRALELDARHPAALLGLARIHGGRGAVADALECLERIGPGTSVSDAAERLAAELRTAGGSHGDEAALRERIAAAPDDLEARLALGRTLAAEARHAEALDAFLEVVRRDPGFADEGARRAMLDLFAILGPEHPLTQSYRAALARALFR